MAATIGALRVVLGADTAGFESSLKNANKQLDKFSKGAAAAGAVIGAGIAAAAIGLGVALKGAIDRADEMGKSAQKIGVAVAELSKLQYAAKLSGIETEGLSNALKKLSVNMADAAVKDTGKASSAFAALGISVTDSAGALKSSTRVIEEIAGKFDGMADGAGKTALAVALFGKSGTDMIPMLNSGAAVIKEMTDEAAQLGLVIDSQTAAAAERFNDNLDRLQAAGTGVSTQMAGALAPALADISDALIIAAKDADLMGRVAGFLDAGLRVVAATAITVGSTFSFLASTIGMAARAAGAFIKGDLSFDYGKNFANYQATVQKNVDGTRKLLAATWSKAGAESAKAAPRVSSQIAAPLMQGADKAKAAAAKVDQEAKRAAQALERAFDFFDPSSVRQVKEVEENLALIRKEFDAGRISAERYAQAVSDARTKLQDIKGELVTDLKIGSVDTDDIDRARDQLGGFSGQGQEAALEERRQRMLDTFDDISFAGEDLASALEDHNWTALAGTLANAFSAVKAAFASGSATDKFSAVAGMANAAGQAIGGTAGSTISGAASGAMAGFQIGGPMGAAAGAVIGGVMGFLSGNKAKKAEKQAAALKKAEEELAAARALAEAAARKVQEQESLRVRLLNASGDATGALALTRKMELATIDAANRSLAEAVYQWEDYNTAVTDAEGRVAEATAAAEQARSDLTAAYEREKGAIEAVHDRWQSFVDSFRAFGDTLRSTAAALLGPQSLTAALGARFRDIAGRSATGDEKALGELQSVSEEYLEATKSSAKTLLDQKRVLADVRSAVSKAGEFASTQVDMASLQLSALNASVQGLIAINDNVIGVGQAITNLAAALSAQQAATATAAQIKAAAPPTAGAMAGATDWSVGGAAWNSWAVSGATANGANRGDVVTANWARAPQLFFEQYANAQKAGSLSVLDAYFGLGPGTAAGFAARNGLPAFANGGSFTVGGAGGIDSQVRAMRLTPGEMVDVRTPGSVNDNARETASLRAEVAMLRFGIEAIARNTEVTAKINRRWEGDGLPPERDMA